MQPSNARGQCQGLAALVYQPYVLKCSNRTTAPFFIATNCVSFAQSRHKERLHAIMTSTIGIPIKLLNEAQVSSSSIPL